MDLSSRNILRGLVTAVSLVAATSSGAAQSSIAGDYECAYGCRVTDAAPSVEIDEAAANWGMNELGGDLSRPGAREQCDLLLQQGGTLLNDGVTLQWADGVIWKRHRMPVALSKRAPLAAFNPTSAAKAACWLGDNPCD